MAGEAGTDFARVLLGKMQRIMIKQGQSRRPTKRQPHDGTC